MKQTNLNLYRSFIAVYENGSISTAAKVLGLKQPTVTHNIKELEKTLGVILFIPHARGVTPTIAATKLYKYAKAGIDAFMKGEEPFKNQ